MSFNKFNSRIYCLCSLLCVLFIMPLAVAGGVYQQPQEFLQEVFKNKVPKAKILWLTKETQKHISQIMGHKYPRLRLRYWQKGDESAWILEEIGKEEPITVGIHIENNKIKQLKVLIYRENRGDEVRHRFFTRQFDQVSLASGSELNQPIDGITGATLSVRALKKMSIMALWLSSQLEPDSVKQN